MSKTTNITKIVVENKVINVLKDIANTFIIHLFNKIGTTMAQKFPNST